MSDNMEREKNERLTTREIEEEEAEMRRELSGMGMYEPGYTYKDMKAILGFISESKDMAKMGADSKNAQKESLHSSNNYKSEDITKINSPQDSESKEHMELPKASYSYRTGHGSPTAFDRISTCGSSSPDSMMFDLKSSVNRHKNADRDEAFERLHDNTKTRDTRNANKYMTLSPHNISHDSQSMSSMDGKVDNQLEHSQLLDRWRIDPFDVSACENDVPLQGPARRPVHERVPFRQCREAQTPEKREKTIIELSAHMGEMADLWHSWHRTTDPKFQWGSPIQVGTANGSLDKSPLKETNAEHDSDNTADKDSRSRVCKRKAPVAITSLKMKTACMNEDVDHDDDDDDDDDDDKVHFVYAKRRKPTAKLSRTLRSSRVEHEGPSSSGINNEITNCLDDYDTEQEEITIVGEKGGIHENKSTSPARAYPRRIIPPNPRVNSNTDKKRLALSLRNDELDSRVKNNGTKFQQILDGSDRQKNDDGNSEDKGTMQTKEIALKSLSVRLQRECTILKVMEAPQVKNSTAKREEAEKKTEEENKRRKDFRRRQLQEIETERKRTLRARKVTMEKGAKYNEVLQLKEKECRVRLLRCREAEEKTRLETEEEDRLLADTDDEEVVDSNVPGMSAGHTNCPICFATFANDKIEMHAAECKQYGVNAGLDRRNSVQGRQSLARNNTGSRKVVLECNICSIFTTTNGVDYEAHVNDCLQRKEREHNRSPETTTNVLSNLPHSPINCFRSISEQAESEINYKSQFATGSKAHSNRKRKR